MSLKFIKVKRENYLKTQKLFCKMKMENNELLVYFPRIFKSVSVWLSVVKLMSFLLCFQYIQYAFVPYDKHSVAVARYAFGKPVGVNGFAPAHPGRKVQ